MTRSPHLFRKEDVHLTWRAQNRGEAKSGHDLSVFRAERARHESPKGGNAQLKSPAECATQLRTRATAIHRHCRSLRLHSRHSAHQATLCFRVESVLQPRRRESMHPVRAANELGPSGQTNKGSDRSSPLPPSRSAALSGIQGVLWPRAGSRSNPHGFESDCTSAAPINSASQTPSLRGADEFERFAESFKI